MPMPDSTPTPAPPKGELPSLDVAKEWRKANYPDEFVCFELKQVDEMLAAFAESELTRSRAALLELQERFTFRGKSAAELTRMMYELEHIRADRPMMPLDWATREMAAIGVSVKPYALNKVTGLICKNELADELRAALLEMERQRDELRHEVELFRSPKDALTGARIRHVDAVLAAEAKLAAAEQSLAQQRWIQVSEKLPEPLERVLAVSRGNVVMAYADLERTIRYAEGEDHFRVDDLTHWRELPPAPSSLGTEKK